MRKVGVFHHVDKVHVFLKTDLNTYSSFFKNTSPTLILKLYIRNIQYDNIL